MWVARSRMTMAALGLVLSLAACGNPLEPSTVPVGSDSPSLVLQDAQTLAFLIADASDRLVPSLDPGSERDLLAGALGNLYNALEDGAVVKVRLALGPMESALARYPERASGDGTPEPELDAIMLAVDAVAADAGRH